MGTRNGPGGSGRRPEQPGIGQWPRAAYEEPQALTAGSAAAKDSSWLQGTPRPRWASILVGCFIGTIRYSNQLTPESSHVQIGLLYTSPTYDVLNSRAFFLWRIPFFGALSAMLLREPCAGHSEQQGQFVPLPQHVPGRRTEARVGFDLFVLWPR